MPINTAIWSILLGLTINIILIVSLTLPPKEQTISAPKKSATTLQKKTQQLAKVEIAAPTKLVKSDPLQVSRRQKNIHKQLTLLIKKNNPWQAVVSKNNIIRLAHKSSDFDKDHRPKNKIQNRLKNILTPVVILLSQPHISQYVEKISLVSHTSSNWKGVSDKAKRLKLNRILSQQRARGLYFYLFSIPKLAPLHDWMRSKIQVFGRSSDKSTSKNALNKIQSPRVDIVIVIK